MVRTRDAHARRSRRTPGMSELRKTRGHTVTPGNAAAEQRQPSASTFAAGTNGRSSGVQCWGRCLGGLPIYIAGGKHGPAIGQVGLRFGFGPSDDGGFDLGKVDRIVGDATDGTIALVFLHQIVIMHGGRSHDKEQRDQQERCRQTSQHG